jgi:hypothetical protein
MKLIKGGKLAPIWLPSVSDKIYKVFDLPLLGYYPFHYPKQHMPK